VAEVNDERASRGEGTPFDRMTEIGRLALDGQQSGDTLIRVRH
jgi:hypothetical protein